MTVIGKILVFLILVFSLVVGGLVVVAFMTRVNWEDAQKKTLAALKAAEAASDQSERALKAKEKEFDDELKKKDASLKDSSDTITRLTKDLADAKAQVAKLEQAERVESAKSGVSQSASEARRVEVTKLKQTIIDLVDEKQKMLDEITKERKSRIQAEVQARSFQARNLELNDKLKDAIKDLIRAQSGPAGTVVSRKQGEENPPRDNIEGRILTVDPEDNLVKLSIGSDAGLEVGHTLKVFRLNAIAERSQYLGVIEILSVRNHEAVGKPIKQMPMMRPSDRVASRLVVGN